MSPNPSPQAAPPPARWLVVAAVLAATVVEDLPSSILTVALPDVMRDFSASVAQVEWVVSGRTLTLAALTPLAGWLSVRWERRRLLLGAILLMGMTSLAAALAPGLPWLVLARVLEAVATCVITPACMVMLASAFAPHERPRVMGTWLFASTAVRLAAPLLGGVLTQWASWRAIFLVMAGLCLLTWAAGLRAFPASPPAADQDRALDPWGFLGLASGLGASLLAARGWPGSASGEARLVALAVALAGGALFALRARRPDAVLDVGLLRHRNLALALLMAPFRGFVLMGSVFLLSLHLPESLGLTPPEVALVLMPATLVAAAVTPGVGWLVGRWGARWPAALGGVLVALSLAGLARAVPSGPVEVALLQALRGAGVALLSTPPYVAVINALPAAQAGAGASWHGLAYGLGSTTGVAGCAALLAWLEPTLGRAAAFQGALRFTALIALLGLIPALLLDDPQTRGVHPA
ncbi:MFS transporter [Pyxidicoccus fallax]|uniref:Multidrug efflux MFS transporter n=1 Tax=Pyxidicoccus fallax TaxID=394095 RepID=A0A848LWH7_9BACT|nr:MFS transporter [Pyxidicoccus fallax]NMO21912.1 multidrug efflux MFS transporter [Pyxidicoccus fallax]NPC84459.1 MFS transporter [Pyxidicoccus fallax]